MNTRRYPRSTQEAFQDADYASPAECNKGHKWSGYDYESAGHRCVFIISLVGVVGFLLWALLGALS